MGTGNKEGLFTFIFLIYFYLFIYRRKERKHLYNGVSVEVRGTTFGGQFFLKESPLIINIFSLYPQAFNKVTNF